MTFKSQILSIVRACSVWRKREPENLNASDYHLPILSETNGNLLIRSIVEGNRPFLAARIGNVELACLHHFDVSRKRRCPYSKDIADDLGVIAGFFPLTDEALDEFCKIFLDAIRQVDIMAVWFNFYENRIVKKYCPRATLVRLRSLEPYYHAEPWTKKLQGKRVLVVHPFAESVKEQYANKRELLFENVDVLPKFELLTIKAVQSIAGEPTGFATWFEALDSMKASMDAVDYDVCIVGAGAYGLPLAAHAKRSGRQVVHLGGATQILFGIKGRRWDGHEIISTLYNEAWVRPKDNETPKLFTSVEGGSYW